MGRSLLLFTLSTVLCAQAPQEPAHIKFFQAVNAAQKGGTVTIRWSATGVERVRLEPLGVELPATGEMKWPVQDRIVFWLNAVIKGGQSTPLVVEPLPEPVIAQPAPPQLLLGAANQPGTAAPVPAAGHARAGRAWIQFATMTDPRYAERLRRRLGRCQGLTLTLSEQARHGSARKRLRLRAGPFRTLRAARYRVRRLEAVLAAMNLKPLVILDRSAVQQVYVAED